MKDGIDDRLHQRIIKMDQKEFVNWVKQQLDGMNSEQPIIYILRDVSGEVIKDEKTCGYIENNNTNTRISVEDNFTSPFAVSFNGKNPWYALSQEQEEQLRAILKLESPNVNYTIVSKEYDNGDIGNPKRL